MSYLKFLMMFSLVGIAMLFGACGSGSDVTNEGDENLTVVVNIPDVNIPLPTQPEPLPIIEPIVEVVPSDGYINQPRPVFQDGSYAVNAPEYGSTFFITNMMDVNDTLVINPKLVNTVYDVILYTNLYERVDAVEYISRWSFTIPARGYYNIEIKTYEEVEVVISVDGWADKY